VGTFFGGDKQRKMDKITGEEYMACGPLLVLLTKYYQGDRVEDEMGGACGTNRG
jgi:hypothetical protein